MTYPIDDDSELRRQLRHAWQQIADLQWKLQAEQRSNRRQEGLLATQNDVLADARQEHDHALADRDQEIADLEDEHTGRETVWHHELKETRRKSDMELAAALEEHERFRDQNRNDLRLVQDLLQAYIAAVPGRDTQDELMHWVRRCGVVLEMADTLDGTGAAVQAALRRAVETYSGVTVDVQLNDRAIGRNQIILCGLLLHNYVSCTPGQETEGPGRGTHVSIAADPNTPSRIVIALPWAPATTFSAAGQAMLQSLLAQLHGIVESSGDTDITVSFPAS